MAVHGRLDRVQEALALSHGGSPRAPSGFLPTIALHGVSSAGYPLMRLAPYETRFFRLQKPPHAMNMGRLPSFSIHQ